MIEFNKQAEYYFFEHIGAGMHVTNFTDQLYVRYSRSADVQGLRNSYKFVYLYILNRRTLLIFKSLTIVFAYLCDFRMRIVNASWSICSALWQCSRPVNLSITHEFSFEISNKIVIFSILWSDKLNAFRWVGVAKRVPVFPRFRDGKYSRFYHYTISRI